MRIHFVARQLAERWPDLNRLTSSDVDRHAARFRGGVNNWVVQTYLHLREPLREVGIETSISERFLLGAMCVSHRDCLNCFLDGSFRSFVVGVRADRPPLFNCNLVVVQNPLGLENHDTVFLPFWPQPGIKPRGRERGTRIERMAYLGRAGSAPRWYTDPSFHDALRALGVQFEVREADWRSYHDVDLVLACRDDTPTLLAHKPASKLVNAWLAGVPALLSPEPAFLHLRQQEDDFCIVRGPEDVLAAVAALQADPARYQRMIQRGTKRGAQWDRPQVIAAWMRLLTGRARREYELWLAERHGNMHRFAVHAARTLRQKLQAKQFRRHVRADLMQLQRA